MDTPPNTLSSPNRRTPLRTNTQSLRDNLLNHSIRTTRDRHYDAYRYTKQKRNALMKWNNRLETIIDEDIDYSHLPEEKQLLKDIYNIEVEVENYPIQANQSANLKAHLETIKNQLQSPQSNEVIVQESKKQIREILSKLSETYDQLSPEIFQKL